MSLPGEVMALAAAFPRPGLGTPEVPAIVEIPRPPLFADVDDDDPASDASNNTTGRPGTTWTRPLPRARPRTDVARTVSVTGLYRIVLLKWIFIWKTVR